MTEKNTHQQDGQPLERERTTADIFSDYVDGALELNKTLRRDFFGAIADDEQEKGQEDA